MSEPVLNMRFKVGDKVWVASFDNYNHYQTCPDCGGTGRLRVTFHDETQVSIECRNCASGYDAPTGRVYCCEHRPRARLKTITDFELSSKEGVKWKSHLSSCSWQNFDDDRVFETEAEALAKAAQLADEFNKQELERLNRKEKDTRSWAWNASYHRREIKRAEKSIEYHKSKLAVAAIKAKEPLP